MNHIADQTLEIEYQLNTHGIKVDPHNGHLFFLPHFSPQPLAFDLIFVRHGETFGNCGQVTETGDIDYIAVQHNRKDSRRRIFQGNTDTPINQLTNTGNSQALHVAQLLENEFLACDWNPDVIFHSGLGRARDTGLPFVCNNNFDDIYLTLEESRELCFGAWSNRRVCDLATEDPCHLFYREQNSLVKKSGLNAIGNFQQGENFCEGLLRSLTLLQNLNKNFSRKKLIIFSHSMIGAALFVWLGKASLAEQQNYLAFDGKDSRGNSYAMKNAHPYYFQMTI